MTGSSSAALSNRTVRPSERTLWNRIFTGRERSLRQDKPFGEVTVPDTESSLGRANYSLSRSSKDPGLIGVTSGGAEPAEPVQSPPKSFTMPVASWNRARSFPFSKKMYAVFRREV